MIDDNGNEIHIIRDQVTGKYGMFTTTNGYESKRVNEMETTTEQTKQKLIIERFNQCTRKNPPENWAQMIRQFIAMSIFEGTESSEIVNEFKTQINILS